MVSRFGRHMRWEAAIRNRERNAPRTQAVPRLAGVLLTTRIPNRDYWSLKQVREGSLAISTAESDVRTRGWRPFGGGLEPRLPECSIEGPLAHAFRPDLWVTHRMGTRMPQRLGKTLQRARAHPSALGALLYGLLRRLCAHFGNMKLHSFAMKSTMRFGICQLSSQLCKEQIHRIMRQRRCLWWWLPAIFLSRSFAAGHTDHFRPRTRAVTSDPLFNAHADAIPHGAELAVSILTMEPVAYQLKGAYAGRKLGVGIVDVTECYSASPPLLGEHLHG
jgi:hypothetical protein